LINRVDKNDKLWSLRSKSRVCSEHFDGEFPYPTKNLNYDGADDKLQRLPFLERFSKRRKLTYQTASPTNDEESESIDFEQNDHCTNRNEQYEYQVRLLEEKAKNFEDKNKALVEEINILKKVNTDLTSTIHKVNRTLKSTNHVLKKYKTYSRFLKLKNRELLKGCKCKKPVFEKLLTSDTNVLFYSGCENWESFEQLHSVCIPCCILIFFISFVLLD